MRAAPGDTFAAGGGSATATVRVPDVLSDTVRSLWPDATTAITRGARAPGHTVDYLVLPSVSSPRWLLPAEAPVTAGVLTSQEGSLLRRSASGAAALAHRTGVLHRLPIARLRIAEDGESLVSALAQVVGPDAGVAIRLGSWRHARSAVLRVFTPTGTTAAFGKVGIDAHGKASVQAEAEALQRIAALGLSHIDHPRILHRGSWRDLDLLLVSPLLPLAEPSGGDLPVAAMRELVHADGVRTDVLRHSGWWAQALDRLDTVTDRAARERLVGALGRLEAAAVGLPLPLACWHGDWTPWNMAPDPHRVLLWDWEHFADDVPVGFDHVHYLAQQLRVSAGTGPDAEAAWLRAAADALARHVDLDERRRALVSVAYLIEINLRFTLDRQTTAEAGARRDGWGLDLLRRVAEELRPA